LHFQAVTRITFLSQQGLNLFLEIDLPVDGGGNWICAAAKVQKQRAAI